MKISDLTDKDISRLLGDQGLRFKIGPFIVNLTSPLKKIADNIALFYGAYPRIDNESFADFHVSISRPVNFRRWLRPQVIFSYDGLEPFQPLPCPQAFAMFEWGLNWCIATTFHNYLIIHAAVIAKDDQAIILPGEPGAGKSTLCAALASRGWRLLSDEMALIDPETLAITPVPRPIGLKNESIEIIRNFSDTAILGPSVKDTTKGTIAHMRPSMDSIVCSDVCAKPHCIVFPKYAAGSTISLDTLPRAQSLVKIAEHGFNYHILGDNGFTTLKKLLSRCPALELTYSKLNEAVDRFNGLIT